MIKPIYAAIILWAALLLCLIISSSCKGKQFMSQGIRHDTITASKSFYRHDTTHEACTIYLDTAARQMIINKTTVYHTLQTTKDTAKESVTTQRQNAKKAESKTTTKENYAFKFIISFLFFSIILLTALFLGLVMRNKRL